MKDADKHAKQNKTQRQRSLGQARLRQADRQTVSELMISQ